MKLSLLKYSAWISLVVMALVSCRSSQIIISGEQARTTRESCISGSFEKLTFKAKVTYKERELAGRMLIKNTGDGNYKIAFYNELGITYLEGTFRTSSKKNNLIINTIAPVINTKLFLKNFEKSLQTVFSDKKIPCHHATMPPCHHASMPPEQDADSLTVQLRNGFTLKLYD